MLLLARKSAGFLALLWLLSGQGAVQAAQTWESMAAGKFTFFHAPGQGSVAVELVSLSEPYRAKVMGDLGIAGPEHIEVYLADSYEAMGHAAPGNARVPSWAAGMAFSRHSRILLRVDSHSGRARDVGKVFLHELAHLALNHVVSGQAVPRWFHEGFAIYESGEWSLGRTTTLASGVISGRLFSLQSLTESFPASPPDVELAYAQSIDFVAYLLSNYGRDRFHGLIDLLGRGWSFLNAVEEAYDDGIFRIEADWQADLRMRFTWLPILTGTATLWFLATLVLVAAWLRKRRTRSLAIERLGDPLDSEDDLPPPPLTPNSP